MDKRKERMKRPISGKARKQRKFRYNAPNHIRRKMIAARVDDHLRYPGGDYSTIPLYPRSMPVRKGDKVKILRGRHTGHEGKVTQVSLKKLKIEVEGCVYPKADGTSIPRPLDPSNVIITHLDMSDKKRKEMVERAYAMKESLVKKVDENKDTIKP